jgi:hypothetical protein
MESAPDTVVRNVLLSQHSGASPRAHDCRHLGHVDQLARRAHRRLGIRLSVLDDQHDLAPEQAGVRVDFVDHRLHRLRHARAVEAARAGERCQHAELQWLALRTDDRRCDAAEGEYGCALQ